MINRYEYKSSIWVDIVNPDQEEIVTIAEEFNIGSAVIKELTSPSVKSRTELYKDYIYLILHFPAFKHSHKNRDGKQEVDFIIGKNFLITARYDTIDPLEKFAKILEVNSILDRGFDNGHTGEIFFGIMQEIYHSLFNELEYMDSWLSSIEEGVFMGKEKEMVISLSNASRELLNFKKSTSFHKDVLESLDIFGKKIFDEHFSYHVRRMLDEYLKVENALKENTAFVSELRETNNSLLSTKQNEIMKLLTVIAFITFPLSLIAGIFGMNVEFELLTKNENAFLIIIAIMFVCGASLFIFFKKKKWL